MNRTMNRLLVATCLLLVTASVLLAQNPCPVGLPSTVTCYSGVDENGAYYLIALPENYNHRLVLWNHGYDLAPPAPLTRATDLGYPVALLTRETGYAVAASSYRPDSVGRGGWAVRDGAEDTDNLRWRFISMFGAPDLTFVVGASEGGLVTATITELFGVNGQGCLNYNGAMPMCGPLAGGRRNWYGGFDLRVVYQYYCQNLPRPSEDPYPLYLGLDPAHPISQTELGARINECTGIFLPPDQRSERQRQNLANILNVTHIPESFLVTDMGFATFALQELSLVRTGGQNPVTDLGVFYTGSTDDNALNAGVFRAGSDPDARDWLSAAYDPTGNVPMPSFTLHTIGDGLVFVENENAYRQTLDNAGRGGNLFQMYVSANGHCQFSYSEFLAAFAGLVNWVETNRPPAPEHVVEQCEEFQQELGDTCNYNLTFNPDTFDSRVPPRDP